ncbi:hypothetical protein HYALB_00001700 [Hymenoscyphus albidus]|uniref:Uncharacterized protein n=1 Tax=Hymenoscyphus albidus TaxID=595503 RepID=A0A9N9Q220_9HELO|nr:hypothetical protein HYALB_00001700 [Hymenoscyphus albidus]
MGDLPRKVAKSGAVATPRSYNTDWQVLHENLSVGRLVDGADQELFFWEEANFDMHLNSKSD